jgi:two-component system, response regulator PdtaR
MVPLQPRSNAAPLWLAASAPQGGNACKNERGQEPLRARSLRVLIVEDEFFISLDTKGLLESLGHVVVSIAVSADQAVSFAERENPDVVLMDIRLNGMRDGIDAADEIRRRFGIASIFVTANSDPQTRRRADDAKPLAFIEKPLTEERLRQGLSLV